MKMAKNLQEEQAPIDIEIVNETISCTPDDWKDFTLELEYLWADDPDNLGSVKSSVINSNGDFETPSDELFEVIQKINKLFYRYGVAWIGAKYHIYLTEADKWKYEANFQY